ATDVVDRDDLALRDGGDAVGKTQVELSIQLFIRLGLAIGDGAECEQTDQPEPAAANQGATAVRHGVGRLFRKVIISRNRRRGRGAVNLGNREPSITQSSRWPLARRHYKRVSSVSTEMIPFCSARMRISVTSNNARTS